MDGGCPIYTYALYMDGVLTDVNVIFKKPYLQIHTVTGLTRLGESYQFKIRAINEIDFVDSPVLSVTLAAVPDTPTDIPYQDFP